MNKITVFGEFCLLWIIVIIVPSQVRADMYFNDGGTHVVDYTMSGDVYVSNNTKLTLLTGSYIEKLLYVGSGIMNDASSVILDGGFVGGSVWIHGFWFPWSNPELPHSNFTMLSGSVLNIWSNGAEANIFGGQSRSTSWAVSTNAEASESA